MVVEAEIVETGGLRLLPPPATKKRLRLPLKTLGNIEDELARVYRLAKSGEMDKAEACKLAYLLIGLSKMKELSVLEKRLKTLEQQLEEQGR
jgi:hypothetical protein